jgi:galactose-1-phosphate uridylyltransferase
MGTGIYINVTSPEDAARYLREANRQPDEEQPTKVEITA